MSHNAQGECSQSGQTEDQSSAQGLSVTQGQSDTQGHPEAEATPAQPAEATGQPGELAGLQDLEVPTAEIAQLAEQRTRNA